MATVRVLILRAPGSNCDQETAFAFELAGAAPQRVHINRLREQPTLLDDFQILVIPGGFTYGDDVAAGKILAYQLRHFLHDQLARFRDAGKLILGICNGFQVLLKAGLLVPPDEQGQVPATLAANRGGAFLDRWVALRTEQAQACPFLVGYSTWVVPIAHGEGRFLCRDAATLDRLERAGQLVLRYTAEPGAGRDFNPNGAAADVAGLCDGTGRVLGLMPHPERHVLPLQHPHWTRLEPRTQGDGFRLFRNAVLFCQRA
jgi:phosphoribosylformylglycinamidine synthase I